MVWEKDDKGKNSWYILAKLSYYLLRQGNYLSFVSVITKFNKRVQYVVAG
jgi:hypothetical protein